MAQVWLFDAVHLRLSYANAQLAVFYYWFIAANDSFRQIMCVIFQKIIQY